MANNKLNNNENILIKVDQNNLIYVDPNSVVVNGEVQARNVKQENLVMYVNLEADLIPRTVLTSDDKESTMTSVAKGTFNLLKPESGTFDSSWTESYVGKDNKFLNGTFISSQKYDESAQAFGIESITINVKGGNFIPQININFIDVRGKTLFESPENSPYKAFFHLPWPIFYLTVKGYYGKAIRYRLHMTKFTSRFNESNGNFEVNTTFVGSTYAFLNEIPLMGILNAPYMYLTENDKPTKYNPKTGTYQKSVSKTSRGFVLLKSIYEEYVQLGYLPKVFLEKPRTLREVIIIASTLDRILEREILDQAVDMRVFTGIKEFEKVIENFESYVTNWGKRHLSTEFFKKGDVNNPTVYYKLASTENNDLKNIINTNPKKTNTLEYGIKNYIEELKKTKVFAEDLIKNGGADFKKIFLSFGTQIKEIDKYIDAENGIYGVSIGQILGDIHVISNSFLTEKTKVQNKVEQEMNRIIKDKDKGIGFEPTIRNIFGVIMANAEVYIRLLKDVHRKAYEVSKERAELIGKLSDESTGEAIYPWPEIKKQSSTQKKILAYPRDPELVNKLQSDNPRLWPEIDFLENYHSIATKKLDTLSDKEGGVQNISFVLEGDAETKENIKVSSLFQLLEYAPYVNKSLAPLFYEMWERAKLITSMESFNDDVIKELANIEFENIQKLTKEDFDVIDVLKGTSTQELLRSQLYVTSPFDRYPYYQDQLPTTDYIKNLYVAPYKIEQYGTAKKNIDVKNKFPNLTNQLSNYYLESYRKNIFPYSSDTYLRYVDRVNYGDENFYFDGLLEVNTIEGLISSNIKKGESWVESDYVENIFDRKLFIGPNGEGDYILNTPYFHNQLFNDSKKSELHGKYSGSAYLLLNSLPFLELSSMISGTTRISSLFKEIGATHYIPYHLMLKWGSIYHRHKKFLLENVDILTGCTTSNTTNAIDGNKFFDIDSEIDNVYTTRDLNNTSITEVDVKYSDDIDVGFHPYYQSVFHQIINGYVTYNSNDSTTQFYNNNINGSLNYYKRTKSNRKYWTAFVNNEINVPNNTFYTLLPSDGFNDKGNLLIDNINDDRESNLRLIWKDVSINTTGDASYTGKTFAGPSEYMLTDNEDTFRDNLFAIDGDAYRKVYDLISTFSPSILNEFERLFLDFATEKISEQTPIKLFSDIKYDNFQSLLKSLVTVDSKSDDPTNVDLLLKKLKDGQVEKLKTITIDILKDNNLMKFTMGNPKEIEPYVWEGFSMVDKNNKFSYNQYSETQYTLGETIDGVYTPGTKDLLRLYIGDYPETGTDFYKQFFIINDIELIEDNILQFRPLIYVYAGYVNELVKKYKKENNDTLVGFTYPKKSDFQKYIRDNIILKTKLGNEVSGTANRLSLYLTTLTSKFPTLETKNVGQKITWEQGYNDNPLKLEQYNYFKLFNDRWVAGNSLGQRLLVEEFLYLDKANKDIGGLAYLTLEKLLPLIDPKNEKANLYSVISMLIQGTGFDMRALPAYVNFYGTNYSTKGRVTASKKVANNLFGTFLDVDYQESSPKVVLQYTGPTSKHLDMKDVSKDKYFFKDDSFNIGDPHNNPLIITIPEVFGNADLSQSNKVVAFEISVGDQHQSIFKSVQLDQASIKNTTESFIVQENLGRSETGSAAHQVDIGLFDIYRQSSYTCEVTCMGNVMIQPTMFFYLKNIPMFRGSYWITEVNHNIRGNNISTSFKGVRIPQATLPDPKDSFLASYRVLFDSITNKAIARQKEEEGRLKGPKQYETTLGTPEGNYTIDKGDAKKVIAGEVDVAEAGMNEFGVRYNGFNGEKYIQKVTLNGVEYLRAIVTIMDGTNYKIDNTNTMSVLNYTEKIKVTGSTEDSTTITWKDVKDNNPKGLYYGVRFDMGNVPIKPQGDQVLKSTVTFFKPHATNKTVGKGITIEPWVAGNLITPNNIRGPVIVGPNVNGYGITLSSELARKIGVGEGDVVYFQMK